MNTRQTLVLTSLRNTVLALEDPVFDRPELNALTKKLQQATKAVADLQYQQEWVNKYTGDDGAKTKALRISLRKRLLRLSHHAVIWLEGLPGIEEDVRVPHANTTSEKLLEETARILKNLRPHLKTLYKNGISKESVTLIETTAKALAAKLGDGNTVIARRSRATSDIPDAIRKARRIVGVLDDTIKLEFPHENMLQHRWAAAKRIPAKLGRPKKKKPRNPPTE
jgi:hypothetical protein